MANGYLGFQNPTTEDKKLDTSSLTVGGQTVHRERIQIAGDNDVDLMAVTNSDPSSSAYGGVVRDPGINSRLGEVQASPTANTVLARLKSLEGYLDGVESNQSTMITALQLIDNMISGSEAQVDIVTQPALARTVDAIAAALQTDAIMNAGTALTPKFVIIDAATSGDNTILSAVASKKIRVVAAFLIAAGTVNTRFESGAGGTALTGQQNLVANTGYVLPFNPVGWFETASNTLLNLELSAAISVDGCLVYVEV